MKLAVIGSGGREHAICYKLKQSPKIKKNNMYTRQRRNSKNSRKCKRGYF